MSNLRPQTSGVASGLILATVLWSMMAAALVAPEKASAAGCVEGRLIKGSQSAVYYCYGGRRLAFSNEATYFTWYNDFSQVWTISDAELAGIQLGGLVTPRPGIKMVKIQSDPKVYAVARGAVLRWIEHEWLAAAIFGTDWNKKVLDVSDALFINFRAGASVSESGQYWWMQERDATPTISADEAAEHAPTVISYSPEDGAVNVLVDSAYDVTFSEGMNPGTINASTLTLMQGSTPITGTVIYHGVVADGMSRASFTPSANLAAGTVYTATVTNGAKDPDGNGLPSNVSWSFTTGTY